MTQALRIIADAAVKLAHEVPEATLWILATQIGELEGKGVDINSASIVHCFPHAGYRSLIANFLNTWLAKAPGLSPAAVALSVLTAAHSHQTHTAEQQVELVWTGPEAHAAEFRRTAQAILQVLDSAQERITLVSYAVYRIPHVCEALVRAARRGVRIKVIVETPDRIEGQGEYSTLRALGGEVASCAAVYFWPQENRRRSEAGKVGILHVKCVVADGRWLFLSSANFTEQAFDINMELGMLVTGGNMPAQAEANFDRLVETGVLARV